ncbi:S9 family peptidase [Joostella sp. CR20]|uniref:S9 family peptidase n=1 Tax=Joostella sp. CR20 TaxID=2804312 RepID=UPI00313CC5CC
MKKYFWLITLFISIPVLVSAQDDKLTLDRIYNSSEFRGSYQRPISWIANGDAFVTIERNNAGEDQLIKYLSKNNEKSVFVTAEDLKPKGSDKALRIENFSLSDDESKVLIFTNSSRVWRSNTKGDYWVYDFTTKSLKQIGAKFPSSSLMFAKFSGDNKYVAYVQNFNLYKEDFNTGAITALTTDGTKDIINGTFDWVYEEEFGMRDGFSWSPDAKQIAFWQLDASKIGTFYMINNTDSIYSKPIPVQYPKVGQDPSSTKVAVVNTTSKNIQWIAVPGDPVQHYIPGMQWVNADLLLIQQLNRKQNVLNVFTYQPSTNTVKKIYTETEDTWVDIGYPDASANQWDGNKLLLTDNNSSFLRMTETDGWRHVYKVNIASGSKTVLTPGDYDVASFYAVSKDKLFFSASPEDATQRYLYTVPLNGKGTLKRITPQSFSGINTYDVAPNGAYAIHHHTNVNEPRTTRLIDLPKHETVITLEGNTHLKEKLQTLALPTTTFFKVTTSEGIEVDGRITKPKDFDATKKYPVVFNVYGEPWGQVAKDSWIGLYDIFLAQQGFVVVKMDNRGTPTLKGSKWRKSIYRNVGVINTKDQALAAKEVLKWDFIDTDKVAVWGWSGGGSMTLNLMFKYPEIYKTGIAVAAVSNQLLYDNVYQERYMGLPQENKEDFIAGSPITYAKNLEGNLLVVHGTGDDNVHYQSMEYLINELVKQNKQFDLMVYPNRSHSINEGQNTSRHLYTLITNYLLKHNK